MKSPLKETLSILNAAPALFVLACLPEYLFALIRTWIEGMILLILYVIVKSFIYAGIYGTLSELISGESYLVSFRHLAKNAKQFFFFYFMLSAAAVVIGIFAAAPFAGSAVLSAHNLASFLEIALMFPVLARIISIKYSQAGPAAEAMKKISFRVPGMLFLLLILVYSAMSVLAGTAAAWTVPLLNLPAKYLSLLIFAVIAADVFDRLPAVRKAFDPKDEIFLVNPVYAGTLSGIVSRYYPFHPPFFAVLKALSPKKYKFREFNKVIWNDRYFKKGKLVAITCFTSNSALAYQIAKGFKQAGSTVIMGGPHAAYLPEEALAFCDSVVAGEAEGVWEEIVRDYENGTLKRKYAGAASPENEQRVHQFLLQSEPIVVKDFIETTRGCKFRCEFCSIPSLTEGSVRTKPVPEILELLNHIKSKFPGVNLLENNIYSDPAYAKELFKALIPLKVSWSSFCTIDIAKNDEVLALAKKSGCQTLYIGYEIPATSSEKETGGKLAMAQKYAEFTKKIKAAGIMVRGNFIFGFDSDSWKSLQDIWRFSLGIMPTFSVLSCLTPFPGTKLYDDLQKAGRITNLNWSYYNGFNMVFRHPRLDQALVSRVFSPFITMFYAMTASKIGLNLTFILLAAMILFTL